MEKTKFKSIVKHPPSKRCPKCKTIKPRSGFYKNAYNRDGLCSYCKICKNKVSRFNVEKTDMRSSGRRPATEYKHTCDICGMGHDTTLEAGDCCNDLPGTGENRKGKYKDTYYSDQNWKYTHTYKVGGRRHG